MGPFVSENLPKSIQGHKINWSKKYFRLDKGEVSACLCYSITGFIDYHILLSSDDVDTVCSDIPAAIVWNN